MRLESLNFQRNGICGDPFWSAIVIDPAQDARGRFLATWATKGDDGDEVEVESCRFVQLDAPQLSWRGDRMGEDLKRYLEKTKLMDKFFDGT